MGILAGWQQLFAGAGHVAAPHAGNRGNAPGNPPVQVGSYEFIIPQMFSNQAIVDVPCVPTGFQDWQQYAQNVYGISGLEGGGATGQVPQVDNGPTLFYDEDSGLYVSQGN